MKKRNKGITLTELMITIAILGMLSSIVGVFLVGGLKFVRLSRAKGEIQRDARVCIDLINRNLRQAISTSVTISRYDSNQPPCSMIEFAHINNRNYRFFQKNNNFYISVKEPSAVSWSENKIASNLRNLSYTYPRIDDNSIISVSLCFEKATYEGATKTLQLSVEKVRIMN